MAKDNLQEQVSKIQEILKKSKKEVDNTNEVMLSLGITDEDLDKFDNTWDNE